jgi:hypothetical protein
MANWSFSRTGLALLALCAAVPAAADTQFRIRRMTRDDVPMGKGQCDIRLYVDNEVEVMVRRDTVSIRTMSGQEPRDDGSECNAPMPDRDLQGFNFEVRQERGGIRLLAEPSRRNGYAAVVAIRDSDGGQGRYHFRLTWQLTGDSFGRPGNRRDDFDRPGAGRPDFDRGPEMGRGGPPAGGGFSWNNTIHFNGQGRGESRVGGYSPERLFDATVDIDRGGRIHVSFRTDSGRPLIFSGTLVDDQGRNLKAEVVSEDRRLRGPLYLTLDGRRSIERISLEATDGRDRLRLNWDAR